MTGTHQGDAFIAKQGAENDGVLRFLAVVDDREFGLGPLEQRQRIDDESGDDVQLNLGPQRPVGVHGRHQPVEAIVALHSHA